MSQKAKKEIDPRKALYNRQNRAIHKARSLIGMDLDDCRELARQISGEPSISSLSLKQRRKLIQILKAKGANVYNPTLSDVSVEKKGDHGDSQEKFNDVYPAHLAYWNKRFPKDRPGYASNEQLAWIQTLWELDWDDGRTETAKGLRGFIFRQTRKLEQGPVSHLSFLRDNHVSAVLTPLKEKRKKGAKRKL